MRVGPSIVFIVLLGVLAGCSTPEEKAAKAEQQSYEAQSAVAEERLKLIDEYRECVIDAGEDTLKMEGCDTYLKAADALK